MIKLKWALLLSFNLSFNAQAADYACLPAAFDIFFGDLPSFLLRTDGETPQNAAFYRKSGSTEIELFTGSWEQNPQSDQVRADSTLFTSAKQGRIYVQKSLITQGQGDVLWITDRLQRFLCSPSLK